MLSYNARSEHPAPSAACAGDCAVRRREPTAAAGQRPAHAAAKRAHAAHAAVLGLHTLCCGLPVAATLVASGAVGLAGFALIESAAHDLHVVLHRYEMWILAVSFALVVVGGLAEWAARRHGQTRGFPAFFAVSVACLALNAALIVSHRTAPEAHASAGQVAHVQAPVALTAVATAPQAPVAHAHSHHDHAH